MRRVEIKVCERPDRESALKCVHEGLSHDQQLAFIQTLETLRGLDESIFDGLIVAQSEKDLLAATWVQFTPGSSAVVWPPELTSPYAGSLFKAIDKLLSERSIKLAQLLFPASESVDEQLLAEGGFQRLAELAYLTLEKRSFPSSSPENHLEFLPLTQIDRGRMERIILETYQNTLDCPELNDCRSPQDVLAGYEAQGEFDPENWFLIRQCTQDVGVLILALHPPGENLELVYMGTMSSARGQGLGEKIVSFAADYAKKKGADRLVLAVDERNTPAYTIYRQAGFVLWDRRTVYARIR